MKYMDLENLAKEKKLYVTMNDAGMRTRNKYVWDEKGDNIIRVDQIHFRKFFYGARTPDMPEHQSYKITKKDYEKLIKIIAE